MPRTKAPLLQNIKIHGKEIERVPDQTGEFITPSMARDAQIIPNIAHDALLKTGLRLNPEAWREYENLEQL